MNKLFTYGVSEQEDIMNEKIKSIVIDCGTVTAAGNVLAPINDLRNIDISLVIEREGQNPFVIFNGHLDEYLTGLYAQSVEYLLAVKAFQLTHKFTLQLKGALELKGKDVLKLTLDVDESAFTGIDTAQAGSYVKAYSIPTNGIPSAVSVIRSYAVSNGHVDINMDFGDNVHKIVAAMDFTADYESSSKAKFAADIVITGDGGYKRSLPKEAIESENIMMYDDNPESSVNQLVLFKAEDRLLHGAKLTGRLDAPADAFARIIVEHFEEV